MKKCIFGCIALLFSNIFIPVSFALEQPTSDLAIDIDEAITTDDIASPIDLIEEPTLEVMDQTIPEESLELQKQDEAVEIENNSTLSKKADFEEYNETIIDSGDFDEGGWGGWVLYSNGKLTIEGVVRSTSAEAWYQYSEIIKTIEFGDAELIGSFNSFFRRYINLEEVSFDGSYLASVTDMAIAFFGLKNLRKVSFNPTNSYNSSLRSISNMFGGCSSLAELDLSNFDVSSVTNMSNLFNGCSSLTKLDLSNFDTGSVTNMGSMFSGCSSLTELDVSRFDTNEVTDMRYMFNGCSSLTELDVSRFDTNKVRYMNYMFGGCSRLAELDTSNFETNKVTYMNAMFSNCSSLTELDVTNFDTSNATDMSNMFYGCSSLTELNVNSFDTSKVTQMNGMFYGCSSLTELNVNSFDTSKVTQMNGMFYGCSSLTELNVNSFDTSKVKNMSNMFNGCTSLSELDVSSFDTGLVENMNNMFIWCRNLKEVDVSSFDTSKVTDMSAMFYGCTSLKELNLAGFDTSNVIDMKMVFSGCSSLIRLDLSTFDTSSVTEMISMFDKVSSEELCLILGKRFKLLDHNGLSLNKSFAWQEENNKLLFYSTVDMRNYHNELDEMNTYYKIAYFDLEMIAMGGQFEDGSEINTQRRTIGENWEMLTPVKENYQFDGWYLDKEYRNKFNFDQPASKNETIYAKWIESYVVTIPEKIDLNSEDDLLISGINNGDKSLNVTIKHEESQINQSRMLKLTNQIDESILANVQLEWENELSDEWTILSIPADSVPVSKDSIVKMTKPKDIQAGDYSGQIVFSVNYE